MTYAKSKRRHLKNTCNPPEYTLITLHILGREKGRHKQRKGKMTERKKEKIMK
jgi:hypothetical protein